MNTVTALLTAPVAITEPTAGRLPIGARFPRTWPSAIERPRCGGARPIT